MVTEMEFERITPEQAGVPSSSILQFMDGCKKKGLELHSFMFLRHGKVYAESWYKPYNKDSHHIMFSFTKSLTSTAIGFANQEGLLSIDEYLVDIFPDKIPENPSENLKKCQIKHLLMMGCGHKDEIEAMGISNPDWVTAFLHHEFVYEPGTKFMYNTAGTNMLCAVLKKKTGMNLMEFLKPRLLDKLGMGDVPCYSLLDGVSMGGAGSRLTTDKMARFIQFVANRGVWNGERLLEDSWFDLATEKQIGNAETSQLPDWQQGYGFQFWRCVPEGVFRADGAFGQYGVVCTKQDAVFIVTSASINMHDVLNVIWEEILPQMSENPLPEDKEANAVLHYVLEHNEITPVLSRRITQLEEQYNGAVYECVSGTTGSLADIIGGAGIATKGSMGCVMKPYSTEKLGKIALEFTETALNIKAVTGGVAEVLPVSLESHFNSFELSGKVFGAVGTWVSENRFEFLVYCAEGASGKRFTMNFTEDGLRISQNTSLTLSFGLSDDDYSDIVFKSISKE